VVQKLRPRHHRTSEVIFFLIKITKFYKSAEIIENGQAAIIAIICRYNLPL